MRLQERMRELQALLDACGPALHALLYRLTLRPETAEDLMQELFLKLSRADGFDRAADPRAYAFRAAVNLALDWRRQQRSRPRPTGLALDPPAAAAPLLDDLIQAEQIERLLDALPQVPERLRQAFVLRFIQGESYHQVAAALGCTAHQARALCHKAVAQLRLLLADPQEVRDARQ